MSFNLPAQLNDRLLAPIRRDLEETRDETIRAIACIDTGRQMLVELLKPDLYAPKGNKGILLKLYRGPDGLFLGHAHGANGKIVGHASNRRVANIVVPWKEMLIHWWRRRAGRHSCQMA
jgi:hypothetical protein